MLTDLLEQPSPQSEEARLKVLNVMAGVGPFETLAAAVEAAAAGSKIVVATGLYTTPILIKTPDLVMELKEQTGEVQVSVGKGPLLFVDLQPGETFTLRGFKLLHTSVPLKALEALRSVSNVDEIGPNKTIEAWVRTVHLHPSMNCAVYVLGGRVVLEDCLVSLAAAKSSMVGVVVQGGELVMKNCDVKGHGEYSSVGVYCNNANLRMYESRVYKHRGAAVALRTTVLNSVLLETCEITHNINCGVYCWGEDASPIIQRCKFSYNQGPGLKASNFNTVKVKACEFKQNEVGVVCENADLFLFLCILKGNEEYGVVFRSMDAGRCDGKLKSCDLYENGVGVLCTGSNCFPVLESNSKIAYNKGSGVRVEAGAHPVLLRNEIFENLGQGVLLVTGASAHIERNNIYANTKANIAFGGADNSDTTIIENYIFRGKSEGVFQIEGGRAWIKRNNVFENVDGVVLVDSFPEVTMNSIYDNKRSGLTIAGLSQPKVTENEVFRNTAVGIVVRDTASGLIVKNYLYGNLIQIAVLTKTRMNLKEIKEENSVKGEIQTTLPTLCSLL